MADLPPPEPSHRRPDTKTGPAVVALLALSACGAQGAAPRIDIGPIEVTPVAAIAAPILPARGSP